MNKWMSGVLALMVLLSGTHVARAQDDEAFVDEGGGDFSGSDESGAGGDLPVFTPESFDQQVTPELVSGTQETIDDDSANDPEIVPTAFKGGDPGGDDEAGENTFLKSVPKQPAPPTWGPFKPLEVATPGGPAKVLQKQVDKLSPLTGPGGFGAPAPAAPPPAPKPWYKRLLGL